MEIKREKLFDEVWVTPMTHLCKTYGLSDQELKKVCIKLQIPVPQRGHWAKLAAGQAIEKPELPPLRQLVTDLKRRPRTRVPTAQVASVKSMPPVFAPPSSPLKGELHPALAVLLLEYDQADVEARQLHAKYLWENENLGKRYMGKAPAYGSWKYFCDAGKILRPTHKKSLLRVSMSTYKRAFQLMQALIERLQIAGYKVTVPQNRERLQAERGAVVLNIKLMEKFDAVSREETVSWSKEPRLVRTLNPTGRLTIGIEQVWLGETLISDRFKELIESQWDRVMSAVEYRYAQSLMRIAEQERYRKESEDRLRERQETLRLQEEARQAELMEKTRRQALVLEAKNWQEAEMLRAYLRHLENRRDAGGTPVEGYASWIVWANAVAQALDCSDNHVTSV